MKSFELACDVLKYVLHNHFFLGLERVDFCGELVMEEDIVSEEYKLRDYVKQRRELYKSNQENILKSMVASMETSNGGSFQRQPRTNLVSSVQLMTPKGKDIIYLVIHFSL